MLLNTLKDEQVYFKSTLIECLQEVKIRSGKPIPTTYKSIQRREKQKIAVYLSIHRDPSNAWRMYTGKQIKDIVAYELEQKNDK